MRACHTVILLPDGTRAGTWTPNCWVRVRCVAITPHELICDKLLPFPSHDESAYPIRTHSFHSLSAALPTQAGRICSDLLAPCTGFEPASRFRPNAFKTPSSPPGHTAYVELLIGVEPMTSSLPWMRSTYWTIEAFSFAKTKKIRRTFYRWTIFSYENCQIRTDIIRFRIIRKPLCKWFWGQRRESNS